MERVTFHDPKLASRLSREAVLATRNLAPGYRYDGERRDAARKRYVHVAYAQVAGKRTRTTTIRGPFTAS